MNIFIPLDPEMPCKKDDFRYIIDKNEGFEKVLSTLKERERIIIELYYIENKTLEKCGKELKLSKERIRQIKLKALRKLRHPDRLEIFAEHGIFEAEEALLRLEKIRIKQEKKEKEEYELYTKNRNERIKREREQRQKIKDELEQRKSERNEYLEKQKEKYDATVKKYRLNQEKDERENLYYDFYPGSFTPHRCKDIPKIPPWFIVLNSTRTALISIHPAVTINRVIGDLVYDQWFKYLSEDHIIDYLIN